MDDCNSIRSENVQHKTLVAKHIGSFLLLIFIATFRPTAVWPDFPISLEPVAVLMIGVLLLYKITLTIGFKHFFTQYRVELILLAAYFTVCFISLYLNRWRYQDTQEIIRFGVTFIVITACFPAALFLFSLPQNIKGITLTNYLSEKKIVVAWIPIGVMLLIATLGIIQKIDPEIYYIVNAFFIASEVPAAVIIRSIFRISTDFASICAIVGTITLMFGLIFNKTLSKSAIVALLCCAAIFFVSGSITGKRVFVFTLIFTLLTTGFYYYRDKPKIFWGCIGALFVILHLLVILGPAVLSSRIGLIFPYIDFLAHYELPPIESITINFQHGTFQARVDLWASALKMFSENPLFGVSNGGFRFANISLEQNTHNVILQILIEGGVIGAGLILALITCFILRIGDKAVALAAVVFMITTLLVDYFIDHSVPWIIIVAYFSVWYWRTCLKFKVKG